MQFQTVYQTCIIIKLTCMIPIVYRSFIPQNPHDLLIYIFTHTLFYMQNVFEGFDGFQRWIFSDRPTVDRIEKFIKIMEFDIILKEILMLSCWDFILFDVKLYWHKGTKIYFCEIKNFKFWCILAVFISIKYTKTNHIIQHTTIPRGQIYTWM